MAYNQKNQNTNKEDDFVIYQLQGQKSFLKFKMDWANIVCCPYWTAKWMQADGFYRSSSRC